ncbi:MAG: GvpL/GvpF family gas vesicle protein [Terriglobia bacterium]
MSYLVYCIFRGPLPSPLEIPDGVGGYRVFTANYNGLGAALSKLPEPEPPFDMSNRLAYERVVESFYRHLTVVPIRYGCRVEGPYDAVVLLRENAGAYRALLRELDGFAEVGIQVRLGSPVAGAETPRHRILPDWLSLRSLLSAAIGLDGSEGADLGAEHNSMSPNALIDNLCDSLHGSFVRHKVEFPSSQKSRFLSLHFLVPRDSVESFRSAARHLPENRSFQLQLSGPWPPYNFVDALQR